MTLSTPQRRRLNRRQNQDFDKTLYTGCCTCQLCGNDNCPDGTGAGVVLNQRGYEVCTTCYEDDSTWYDENDQPRRYPLRSMDRR